MRTRLALDHRVVHIGARQIGVCSMRISVTEAKGQLTDLVRRAETGDEVILTRHGHPAVQLVPVRSTGSATSRRTLLASVRRSAARNAIDGVVAARSQDFLYDESGLPE